MGSCEGMAAVLSERTAGSLTSAARCLHHNTGTFCYIKGGKHLKMKKKLL